VKGRSHRPGTLRQSAGALQPRAARL